MSTAASPTRFAIPRRDFDTYARLPDRAKRDLQLLFSAFKVIDQARTVQEGCAEAAARLQGERGMSAANLKRRWFAYKREGWRAVVNKSLLGGRVSRSLSSPDAAGAALTQDPALTSARHTLPQDFVEHWRKLGERNARKWKPAYRMLIRSWRTGLPVPGYGTWQEWFLRENPLLPLPHLCPEQLPTGWTYANLMRYKSAEAEVQAARRGIAAAMEHLPCLSIDTGALEPLQVIVFDDVRTDFLVHVPEANQICELWGLVAMDIATRRIIRFGLRPRIERQDGTKESLLRRDMQSMVCGILRDHGWHADGTTLVVENAAAAISPPFEEALLQATEGQVKVQRTDMITGQVFMDGFPDGNRGNYKGKSWLESYFNLLHNELACIPGQTGAIYQLKPASLEGRRKEAARLLKKGAALPPALRQQLRIPFKTLQEARLDMEDAFRRIDARTEHRLKNFREVSEWRLPQAAALDHWQPWSALANLPPELLPQIETRTRRESPMERWASLYDGEKYARLPASALPSLLMEHRQLTYHGAKSFGFQLGGQSFAFWRPRLEEELTEGAQYLAWFDSSNGLQEIHLTDPQGRYLGTVPRRHGVAWGDREELAREIAKKKQTLNHTLDRVRARHFDPQEQAQRLDDLQHNTKILEAVTVPETEPGSSPASAITERARSGGSASQPSPVDVAAEILRQESQRDAAGTPAEAAHAPSGSGDAEAFSSDSAEDLEWE